MFEKGGRRKNAGRMDRERRHAGRMDVASMQYLDFKLKRTKFIY